MVVRISNLVSSLTEEDVIKLFRKYGTFSELRMITDRYTSKDVQIVYLNFHDEIKAARAIVDFNGMVISDEAIEVKAVLN